MGYCTLYDLRVYTSDLSVIDRVTEELRKRDIINYALEDDPVEIPARKYDPEAYYEYGTCDMVKWYDHEDDMREISMAIPDVRFTLSGDGEDSADIWEKHFWNGLCQRCQAEIVIPPFDPDKLE